MLIKKGAEASLYIEDWQDRRVVLKRRLPKSYRHHKLDREIQTQRTKHEPQMIHKAKEAGVPTPIVYVVDLPKATIVMEYVEGKQVKQVLDDMPADERTGLCRVVGESIGKLHGNGIMHGDLTTSNLIFTPQSEVVFLDFGLSEQTFELEARGVDLHLMKRALTSTHYGFSDECFKAVIKGYETVVGRKATREVLRKIREIERRGRYVSNR